MPLALPTVSPKLLDAISRYYPHEVTVQRLTIGVRDEYGAPAETWANLADHVDIAARVVSNGPGTGAGGWSGEVWAPNGQYDVDGRTMSLHGHYPDNTEKDRVVWAGLTYDIQAVESDAEGVTTRLRTKKVR